MNGSETFSLSCGTSSRTYSCSSCCQSLGYCSTRFFFRHSRGYGTDASVSDRASTDSGTVRHSGDSRSRHYEEAASADAVDSAGDLEASYEDSVAVHGVAVVDSLHSRKVACLGLVCPLTTATLYNGSATRQALAKM